MSIQKTQCRCGELITIRTGRDCKTTRKDRKQVVYTGEEKKHPTREYDIFRCRGCGEPIHETCAAAGYDAIA